MDRYGGGVVQSVPESDLRDHGEFFMEGHRLPEVLDWISDDGDRVVRGVVQPD